MLGDAADEARVRPLFPRVLVRVDLIEADKMDVMASGGLQFAAEASAGIAA